MDLCPLLSGNEFGNLISRLIFQKKVLIFEVHEDDSRMEGTLSQIFDLGLSFQFMKSEK